MSISHEGRIAYSFAEFAKKVGKERTWVYRQVQKGRIRAITGYGTAMIPASEIDRIFHEQDGTAQKNPPSSQRGGS